METTEQYIPKERVDFTHNGATYRYDFENLTVEQAEFANEVLEFKRQQVQKEATSFHEISRSRGAEWLTLVAAYLLVRVEGGVAQPFDLGDVNPTELFAKQLPMAQYGVLKECIEDFFSRTGRSGAISTLLRNRNGVNVNDLLSKVMMEAMRTPSPQPNESETLSNTTFESNAFTSLTNSAVASTKRAKRSGTSRRSPTTT